MNGLITYRHNVMTINSIDNFLNVKGGFNKGQRDVYFIRCLGSKTTIAKDIVDIDQKMGRAAFLKSLFYFRIDKLPALSNVDDMNYYAQYYDNWKGGKSLSTKNNKESLFLEVLSDAFHIVIEKYKLIKPGMTDSIEKNFVVKLLYWLDEVLGDSIRGWTEKTCYKILADNVLKGQEYLFYYLLTLIGCDVLLMERKADIEIVPELKSLSMELREGAFNDAELPKRVPYEEPKPEPEPVRPSAAKSAPVKPSVPVDSAKNVKIVLPERNSRNRIASQTTNQATGQAANSTSGSVLNNQNRVVANTEKSFEELAMLASSIVMITVFNRRGEPESTGSGIMIGEKGYILTNNHVTDGGRFFAVKIEDDDNVYKADGIIKSNANLDMAIIRINKKLKPIPIYNGGKKLVRGQKVVAIGSPLGLFNSVSDGIISGFRKIKNVDMIQFTAPITHGSSGGAVLNMQGEVIGISTAGIDQGQNLNFAVGYESILPFVRGFC